MENITLHGAGNISIGLSEGKLLFSATGGGGGLTNINVSAGTTSNNLSALTFNNSNGVSFGLNGSVITATVATNYLTTAALSNHSHAFATTTTTGASIIVGTTNSNGVTIGVPSFLTTAQAPGAYLTTAALSNHSHNFATTTTNGASIIVGTTNSAGVTIGVPAYLTTAQAPGAYLTTARASNDAIGLNSALTANGVSVTANSSGLSLNFPAFLTTAALSNHSHGNPTLNLTNLSGTTASNSNGFTLSLSAGAGGAGDGVNILAAGTQTANTTGTVIFNNGNGITFGMSNSSVITASHNGLTTARASNDAIGLNTAITQNGVSMTANSSGLSLKFPAFLTTAALSNHSHNFATTTTNGASIIVATTNSNGATIAVPAFLTTAAQSNHSHNLATTTTNGSLIVVATTNSAGATFAVPPFLTTAQAPGAYLTTARASTDGVGLNTAQTNVTWTVNSSGISINASGYAGIGTSATNASITLNSNGLAISVAAPGGGGAINVSAGTTSNNLQTVVFSNSNGVTFGLSGSTITASTNTAATMAMAGGTQANFVSYLSFHDSPNMSWQLSSNAGNLYSNSIVGTPYINFSAGTTSGNRSNITLSNANGVSFGINGGTITASVAAAGGAYTLRDWDNFGVIQTMNLITNLTATGVTQRPIFFPMEIGGNLTWNRGMIELSKVTNSQNNQFTFQFALYSFANSTSINLIASLQNVYDHSSGSSASITGIRRFAFDGIQAAGSTITGGHYVGMMMFSAGAGGTSGANLSLRGGVTANPPLGLVGSGTNNLSTANLSSIYFRQFQGRYTTTSASPPAAVALAAIQGWTTGAIPYAYLQST
jgi:hypothetical protein